ncbi:CxC2 domain-containing protein [Mycena sanguinolenta]|uniref:CxC2 domain-containing protein n=1 Tax=Mycena sanguinolenta TaxID=230812 RepID=A0A8H6TVU3_9AGAR|nr:CxC2 domain-containing protein [Mycena sanguinolenta]
MKRLSHDAGGSIKKRPRNVFSLNTFGHTLKAPTASVTARMGNLSADGRRADVEHIALSSDGPTTLHDDDDDWIDLHENSDLTDATAATGGNRSRKRKWMTTLRIGSTIIGTLICASSLLGKDLCAREGSARVDSLPCTAVWSVSGKRWLVKIVWSRGIGFDHFVASRCAVSTLRYHRWNGAFFDKRELRDLGLRVQLGHRDNMPCSRARRARDKFVVIAPNGFHHVALDFCECRVSGSQFHWEQLLAYGWYPSTPDAPRSAVTLSTLKLFHAVSLQGKTTAYHFFHALAKITDNTGSKGFKGRYQLLLRVIRQWRNLRALKRGGMGNDTDRRTSETRPGELAVECIACPKAGVNLPEKWEDIPADKRFLYAIFLAVDACFRLKRKKISSWWADPSIQDGWAYFVPSQTYAEFVKGLADQNEMSTCTGLAALDHANTKYAQGYAATGCGMVTCGRHEVVCKNGVGDLQKGEKYGNMDYIVASAWQHLRALLFFLLSYDIMCQWSKSLRERLKQLPPALRFELAQYFVKFVIPKLHILGHLRACQEMYSLLFTLGAAQADMEGIERIWSSSGLMGASTREMGPGSRQDTLDDFWHFWNWGKVVGMGETLRKRFLKATKELARQIAGLGEFNDEQQDQISAWKEAVDKFEAGLSQENPEADVLDFLGPTLRDIELELAQEEQERERVSTAIRASSEETMTEYLILGLEIEAQQRQLVADILAQRSPTSKQLTDFVMRRTRMSREIKKLRALQRKYSPGALQHLAMTEDPAQSPEAERAPLLLPSALSPTQRAPPLSIPGLAVAEARLRHAQCSESLDHIRHGLIVKKRLHTYKTRNARHQHQNTRSRGALDAHQRKIDVAAATYRHARRALIALEDVAGVCKWRSLEPADLRMMEDEEEAKKRKQRAMKGKRTEAAQENEYGEVRGVPGLGENTRLISWIWLNAGREGGAVGEEIYEGVKVEWCKAYARVKRWREEVLLLQEEMVRCLRTLEWQAKVWDGRAAPEHYNGNIAYGPEHLEGARAYAARQAAVRRMLAARFRRLWWKLTNRVASSLEEVSSESSGGEEEDDGRGNEEDGSTDEEGVEEGAASLVDKEGGERAVVNRESRGMSREEIASKRAEMDELLAIQSASLAQLFPAISGLFYRHSPHASPPLHILLRVGASVAISTTRHVFAAVHRPSPFIAPPPFVAPPPFIAQRPFISPPPFIAPPPFHAPRPLNKRPAVNALPLPDTFPPPDTAPPLNKSPWRIQRRRGVEQHSGARRMAGTTSGGPDALSGATAAQSAPLTPHVAAAAHAAASRCVGDHHYHPTRPRRRSSPVAFHAPRPLNKRLAVNALLPPDTFPPPDAAPPLNKSPWLNAARLRERHFGAC